MKEEYIFKDEVTEEVLYKFEFGSTIYGTDNKKSDVDYNYVVKSDAPLKYSIEKPDISISVYDEQTFIQMIKDHHIQALECIFSQQDHPYMQYYELDKTKLRHAISSVASNSFGKAFKKMMQGDLYIGQKSLFHSLRIIMFGIQIAKHGKIIDFEEANPLYHAIMSSISTGSEDYKIVFKPIHNALMTEFRKLAPIEKDKRREVSA